MLKIDDLIGAWRLESYHELDEAGRIVNEPLGREPIGKLVYTSDGHMSVLLMSQDRTPLGVPYVRLATPSQKIAAGDSFIGYCGTYEIRGSYVVHHVEITSLPDWTGMEQKRSITFSQGLVLSAPPYDTEHGAQTPVLTWTRY